MEPWARRLKDLMDEQGKTVSGLAKFVRLKQPSVRQWFVPKPGKACTKKISADSLRLAAKYVKSTSDYILTGKGEPYSDADMVVLTDAQPILPSISHDPRPGYVRFPLLEGFAGMGRGDYIGDYPEIVDFVEVTTEWALQSLHGVPFDAIHVITGHGPSMKGTYNDGDLIFADGRVKEFGTDDAYVFRWNGRVHIKYLQLIGPGRVRILSTNKERFPPVEANLEDIEIGGRALAAWTLVEF
jgi:phage repressor protein C with HTH and peptisase S24 domain